MIIQLENITWHVASDSNHAESSPFDFFEPSVVIVRKASLCLMMNDADFLWRIYQFVWNVFFTVMQAKIPEWKRRYPELKRRIHIDSSMNFFGSTMRTNTMKEIRKHEQSGRLRNQQKSKNTKYRFSSIFVSDISPEQIHRLSGEVVKIFVHTLVSEFFPVEQTLQ